MKQTMGKQINQREGMTTHTHPIEDELKNVHILIIKIKV